MIELALPTPEFIESGGNHIAARFQDGSGPTLVWLGGFGSDMRGTKAERIAAFAQKHNNAFLRFDYSGHGESGGRFIDGTISKWLADANAVIKHFTGDRPLLLIGSSMGAWIALRLVQNMIAKNT